MATPVLNSLDNIIDSIGNYGSLIRMHTDTFASNTTAATAASGYITAQRFPNPFTVPGYGSGVTDAYMTHLSMMTDRNIVDMVFGIEYLLGTVTANGGTGTFADGVAMPNRKVNGSSIQSASQMLFAVVTTVMVGAGNYTLTITYTDQGGNGGATSTLTIPNVSAVNSAFLINPHLASGDSGVQDITGITLTGTTGVIKIYGLLVLGNSIFGTQTTSLPNPIQSITVPEIMWNITTGETLNGYRLNNTNGSAQMYVAFSLVADK